MSAKAMQAKEELFTSLGIRHFGRMRLNHRHLSLTGYAMLAFFGSIGVVFVYTAFVSKLLPNSGIAIVDAIKDDYYFCYLLPLLILPTYAILYLNSLSFVHFEQN